MSENIETSVFCDFQKEVIKEFLDNYRKRMEVKTFSQSSFSFLSYEKLPQHSNLLLVKFDGSFIIENYIHIVDFQKLEYDINYFKNETQMIKNLSYFLEKLYDKFYQINEFKTKDKSKLYFPCPQNVDIYCPVCSFIDAMKQIKYTDINTKNDDINILISYITKLSEVILNSCYKISNYVIPAILFDEDKEEYQFVFINANYKFTNELMVKIYEELQKQELSITDINEIAISFDIDLDDTEMIKNLNWLDMTDKLGEECNKIKLKHNRHTILNLLFSKQINKIEKVSITFFNILDEIFSELNEFIEENIKYRS